MKLAQLKSLVKKGESETLEFKKTTANLSAAMETVCAFLNSEHGGKVIIGVKDDGKIIGQEITDKHLKELASELKRINPRTNIDIAYVTIQDKNKVIVLSVGSGKNVPYTYDGRAFVRLQSTTSKMTQEEYDYLYNQNNPQRWESLTNTPFKITDLDSKRIKEVITTAIAIKKLKPSSKTITIPEILKKMELMVNDKLTNAAIILFGKKDKMPFIQSNLQLARFKGINKKEFLDNKEYRGNAFDLYDQAIDFLDFNLPIAARIVGKQNRIETPAIPDTVLREAISNALVHRDYSNAGGSVSIALYSDRINITNAGSLPKGINLKELSREHASVRRNPLIAHVFYLCGKIEKWGRGTLDMIEDCKAVGNPIPKYEEVGNSFSITLPLKEPIHTQEKITLHENLALTTRQKKILDILKAGPLSRLQIMKKLKTDLAERTMQHELVKLSKMNLIKPNGKTKSLTWSLV